MTRVLIDIIAGARPNFMKVAPIIKALEIKKRKKLNLYYRLIHTGQHYDTNMSGSFFSQLGIPKPDINFEVGSGSQAEQTAAIMISYEKLLLQSPSELCLVVGDVNSTIACSIAAQKLHIPVAHVEAGLRSNDWSMPEEINRILTDSISNYFFTTSELANQNLIKNGVSTNRIFFVGNTMIDTLLANLGNLIPPKLWSELNLKIGQYMILTLHRPANVDQSENIQKLFSILETSCQKTPIIFPVHPRTAKTLKNLHKTPKNLFLVEPQPYLEFNFLVKNSLAVITDSGGITEETTIMGVPCMTLRDSTERPETVSVGTNELIGTNPENLKPALEKLFEGKWKKGHIPEKWDGNTGQRIADILENILCHTTS